jgi:hypothetical protein
MRRNAWREARGAWRAESGAKGGCACVRMGWGMHGVLKNTARVRVGVGGGGGMGEGGRGKWLQGGDAGVVGAARARCVRNTRVTSVRFVCNDRLV